MATLRDRLDCGAKLSTFFSYDQSEPTAETTLETALGDKGAEATVAQRSGDRALVDVQRGGQTIAALIVYRWPNGGWAVESGSRCAY